jgi:hypothetical protein
MNIQYNEDSNKPYVRINIEFFNREQMLKFEERFIEMVSKMAEEEGVKVLSPDETEISSINNGNVNDAMRRFADSIVVPEELHSNFI